MKKLAFTMAALGVLSLAWSGAVLANPPTGTGSFYNYYCDSYDIFCDLDCYEDGDGFTSSSPTLLLGDCYLSPGQTCTRSARECQSRTYATAEDCANGGNNYIDFESSFFIGC